MKRFKKDISSSSSTKLRTIPSTSLSRSRCTYAASRRLRRSTSASKILIPLGEYFQAQDDYLDCFGTHEQIGKIGTDIVDNKCSWLINVALAHASTEQRKVLDECYGRKDAEKERRVKEGLPRAWSSKALRGLRTELLREDNGAHRDYSRGVAQSRRKLLFL